MQVVCHSCANIIPAADLDLSSATAKCSACNSLFSFRDQLEHPPAPLERDTVGLPERFAVENKSGTLTLSWSWRKPQSATMLLFLIPWFAFLIFWNVTAIGIGAWEMSFFSIFHVGIGVFIAVTALRQWLNTTVISVDRARLKIDIGPIPAAGRLDMPSSSIEQLFCTATEHHGKNGRRWNTYNVVAKIREGQERRIVSNLDTDRQAIFIEQQLEKHLSIRDRPVAGAIK